MNTRTHEVLMGQLRVAREKEILISTGVGSCLIITFYDRQKKIGGLAHCTLSRRPSSVVSISSSVSRSPLKNGMRDTKYGIQKANYVDTAIDSMLNELESLGSKRIDMESKLVGGANMFKNIEPLHQNIGEENIKCARKILKEKGILLAGESTGGSIGRSVEFCGASGIVTIKIKL